MVLVFDISAELAMFRKAYTTISQVSFAFPPPTAVAGLIGAIAGIDCRSEQGAKESVFWDYVKGMRIAISINNPLRWFSSTVNLLKYKSSNAKLGEHIQSKQQFVKSPCYRVFIEGGMVYSDLKFRLEKNEFIFTPCLGTAHAIADIKYLGEYREADISGNDISLDTIIPEYQGVQADVLKSCGLARETVPFKMNRRRDLLSTVNVLYSPKKMEAVTLGPDNSSGKVWLKNQGAVNCSQVGLYRVGWFNRW